MKPISAILKRIVHKFFALARGRDRNQVFRFGMIERTGSVYESRKGIIRMSGLA